MIRLLRCPRWCRRRDPVPADRHLSAEGSPRSVKATICEVFGPRCGPALRVAHCETGGTFNPRARGRAGERGLFQIHPIHFSWLDETRLWLPGYNSQIAYRLSRGGRDWSHGRAGREGR